MELVLVVWPGGDVSTVSCGIPWSQLSPDEVVRGLVSECECQGVSV